MFCRFCSFSIARLSRCVRRTIGPYCSTRSIQLCFAPNAVETSTFMASNGTKKGVATLRRVEKPIFFSSRPSGQHPIRTNHRASLPILHLTTDPTRPRGRYRGMEGRMPSCASQHIRRSVQYAMKSPEIRHAAYADGFCSRSQ